MLRRNLFPLLAVAALMAAGCGDDATTPTTDTLLPDTAGGDTLVPDTTTPDTVTPDTVTPDTLTPDTLTPDTLVADTEPGDTEPGDTEPGDTLVADTDPGDTATNDTATPTQTCASDLFFSEYLEGTSNNKALEIANFTGAPVNLGDYSIVSLGNVDGVITWAANGTSAALPSVLLASGETYTICNTGITETMRAQCDVFVGTGIGPFEPTPIFFNGNDPRSLAKNGVRIDDIGSDAAAVAGGSGWTVAEVTNATLDHTLVRKASVTAPTTDWVTAAASEWTVLDIDDASSLGTHTFGYTCEPVTAAANVVINEVAAVLPGGALAWVELYNNTATAVNLEGWTLNDKGSVAASQTYTFGATAIIPANGFLVVTSGTDFAFTLDAADGLALKDDEGVYADVTSWKDGQAPESQSWGRVPDGTGAFRTLQSTTPATANDATECGNTSCEATETCGSCATDCGACAAVKLNEVLFASADASPAFIELYNADAAAADISGWSLVADSGDSYEIPDNTVIAAGAYLVLDATTTGITLTDTDGVGLTETAGVELQGTTWSALVAGESWGRVPNVTGPFAKLAAPSPGAENVGGGGPIGCGSELFFSEYVEGSSNNKALEIANFTGAAVDLAGYEIWTSVNGAAFSATPIALTGTLANADVFLICHSSYNTTLLDTTKCDMLVSTTVITFNGDDARGLAKKPVGGGASTLIDVIGLTPGSDTVAGWDVAGVTEATANHTIRRKSTVTAPNTDWAAAQAAEWDVYDVDTSDGLGSHVYGGTCP